MAAKKKMEKVEEKSKKRKKKEREMVIWRREEDLARPRVNDDDDFLIRRTVSNRTIASRSETKFRIRTTPASPSRHMRGILVRGVFVYTSSGGTHERTQTHHRREERAPDVRRFVGSLKGDAVWERFRGRGLEVNARRRLDNDDPNVIALSGNVGHAPGGIHDNK